MPSSVTFLLQENSSSSLEKNHMLEHSFDESESDDDNQDHQTKTNHLSKSDNQGEAILLDTKENLRENLSIENDLFSPDELETNTQNSPKPSSTSPIRTRRMISKIPIRLNSPSQSRSSTHTRQLLTSTRNNGAFQFFTPKDDRKRLASSDDDDDDIETNQLKEDELKRKLKEQKRYGKKTGELLTKLHENYEDLLEKYAQAENTIDQLRFQPKIFDDNTPRSTVSEHLIHLTQPAKTHHAPLRSSGIYRSTTGSPLSSIRPVTSTTTNTTPARKSTSPAYSGTIESIVFDEIIPNKFKAQLVIETKALAEKMKTFLTLMDENQLNLAEQKQVYENIRQDYERLMKEFEQRKQNGQMDIDLTQELENMKQLLKEIVNKVTQNLLGKSSIESSPERTNNDNSQSSQLSIRSALCNHNDLMNQYEKLLHAVNTTRPEPIRSELNIVTTNSKTQQSPMKTKPKPYVYVSGDSNDEQEDDHIAPIPYTKGIQSTSLELDYVPSTSVKHHQHRIEERRDENYSPKRKEKEIRYPSNRTYDHDNNIRPNNQTKLNQQSKISPRTMTDRHFPSSKDDDEQESISSTSSSTRSSDSGSASPGSPYSKRYDNRKIYQEKSTDHSSSHLSNTDTHLTGSFDPLPSTSYKKTNMHRSYHTWKPQKSLSSLDHHSRLTPVYRSTSVEGPPIGEHRPRSYRSPTVLEISSKMKNNSSKPLIRYQSSIFIDQTHTNQKSLEKPRSNLYLDPQTGIVYQYESNQTSTTPRIHYQSSPIKKLYECDECGAITTYHHRHHIKSTIKRLPGNIDDQGYESGTQKRSRKHRYIEILSSPSSSSSSSPSCSSDSDSELNPTYLEMLALNRAYNRAENIRHQSRCLSRHIIRQLRLALATL